MDRPFGGIIRTHGVASKTGVGRFARDIEVNVVTSVLASEDGTDAALEVGAGVELGSSETT